MKQFVFWVAALAMVFFTSCQQEQTPVTENAIVNFSISTPAIGTRADEFDTTGKEVASYGDGATVNVLKYALYEAELNADGTVKNLIGDAKPGKKDGAFPDDATETTIEGVSAIKGKTYAAFFWAEAEGDPYTVEWTAEGPIATLSDAAAVANNENLDAFFGVHTFTLEQSGQLEDNIYLKRPFAQLNITTTDKSDAEAAKVTVTETEIELTAPNSLNLLTGRTIGTTTVKLKRSAIPENMYVDLEEDGKYDLLSFNYIFVDGDPYTANDETKASNQEVTFRYKYSEDAEDVKEYTFDGITLQRNHRTYVVGSLLTEVVTFYVKINPVWDDSHIYHGDGTGSTPPAAVVVPAPVIVSTSTMDGDERVQLSWTAGEGVTKTIVSWGSNVAEFEVTRADDVTMTKIIEDLDEGDIAFTLTNYDKDDNASDPVEVTAHAYGDQYKASLTTRNMSNLAYVGSSKVATPTFEAWDKGMYTAITYTGASEATLVQNSATTATLSNVALGEEITYYTVYKPNNCMDTFDGPKKTAIARSIVPINVMQFNVKNDSYNWDSVLGQRVNAVVARIKDNDIHIAGLQELYDGSAYTSLMNKLGNGYAGVTYGRTKGSDREALAIVWKTSKFTLKTHGRFWYNGDNINAAGYTSAGGITAKFERFCVWAILTENTSGIEYLVATTHLASKDEDKETTDYMQFPLKWTQARWLGANIKSFAKYEESNILRSMIITGDFNCNNNTMPILTGFGTSNHVNASFYDTWDLTTNHTSPDSRDGYVRSTMNDDNGNQQKFTYFDYVFVNKADDPCKLTGKTDSNSDLSHKDSNCASAIFDDCKVEVLSHTIHPAKYNSTHISDHNAVSVQLKYTYPNPE